MRLEFRLFFFFKKNEQTLITIFLFCFSYGVYAGAALATVTSGGYLLVTMGLLIGAATGELQGRTTVIIFMSRLFLYENLSLSHTYMS